MEEQGAAEFVDVVVHPGDLFVNRTHSTATFVYQAGDKIPQNNSLQHRMARFLLPPGELVWGAAAPTISQARKDHMSRTQLFEKHRNRLDKKIGELKAVVDGFTDQWPDRAGYQRVAILYNTAIGWGQQMENEAWPPPKTLQEGMEADNQRNLLNEQMEKLKHWSRTWCRNSPLFKWKWANSHLLWSESGKFTAFSYIKPKLVVSLEP
ncbi:hypothetical protein niasHT_022185 [Heterodera trifolii]|uniref:Uncharacterized protein n=1 Tax=Heterodera trifolii TaxID=157864 RepID=A0ABD2JWA2_9BILA